MRLSARPHSSLHCSGAGANTVAEEVPLRGRERGCSANVFYTHRANWQQHRNHGPLPMTIIATPAIGFCLDRASGAKRKLPATPVVIARAPAVARRS